MRTIKFKQLLSNIFLIFALIWVLRASRKGTTDGHKIRPLPPAIGERRERHKPYLVDMLPNGFKRSESAAVFFVPISYSENNRPGIQVVCCEDD